MYLGNFHFEILYFLLGVLQHLLGLPQQFLVLARDALYHIFGALFHLLLDIELLFQIFYPAVEIGIALVHVVVVQ